MEPFPLSREHGAPDANGFIHDPRENDVLCGRGGASLRHPGNQTYRRLVNLNKGLYSTCLKTEKLKISRSIVAAIREQQGRFLEKASNSDAWVDIGDKKAVEKTSQALREGQPKLRQKIAEMGVGGATMDPYELSSYTPGEGGGSTSDDINMTMQGQLLQHKQQILDHQRQELLQEQQRQEELELVQQQQHQQLQEQQYRQELLRQQQQPQDMFRGHSSGSFDVLSSGFLNGSNQSMSGAVPAFQNGSTESIGNVGQISFLSDTDGNNFHTGSNPNIGINNQGMGSTDSISFRSDSNQSMVEGSNFRSGNNPNMGSSGHINIRSTRAQDMQIPAPMTSASRQADLHADMLQRLTLQDLMAPASCNGNHSLTYEQQQRMRLRPSLTNTRASLVRELGIAESNLSLMSEFSAYGPGTSGTLHGGGSMSMNSGPSMQSLAANQMNESMGMMTADSSYKRQLMGMPLGSIQTVTTLLSGGNSGHLSLESPSMQSLSGNSGVGAHPNLQSQFRGTPSGCSPAAIAVATAAAVNSNNTNATDNNLNFDRRRLFAKMKYARPVSGRQETERKQQAQHLQEHSQSNSSSNNMGPPPPSSQMQHNMGVHSMDELMVSGFHMLESNNMLESNTSLYSAMSSTGGLNSSSHDPKSPAVVPGGRTIDSNLAAPAPIGPTRGVVETAKVVDHSQPKQRDLLGDAMSAGSRRSIMSGLSRISDTSIDQSIFSDLSKKIGNVSTRSMAMSECSAFDITEAGDDVNDNDDDDFVQGRAAVEGGPVASSKSEIEFQML